MADSLEEKFNIVVLSKNEIFYLLGTKNSSENEQGEKISYFAGYYALNAYTYDIYFENSAAVGAKLNVH